MTAQKADFTDVYVQPDPRAYYRTLARLDYEIPEHGCPVFRAVIDELREPGSAPTVLDLCCSYGVNAALLNHDLALADVSRHYEEISDTAMSRAELLDVNREWYAARRRADAVDVVGLDISGPAVRYAVEAGLLASGIVADLETEPLHDADAAKLAGVDLITVTGGIGYVNERTFEQIYDAADEAPWVAALSLRWIDFEPVAETLASQGLVTERVDGFVVPQRRVADQDEHRFVLSELEARGVEPIPAELSGTHCAALYVARPAGAAAESPVTAIVDGLQGLPLGVE